MPLQTYDTYHIYKVAELEQRLQQSQTELAMLKRQLSAGGRSGNSCALASTPTHQHLHAYTPMYTYMCAHTYTREHTHTHAHTRAHTHTHTHRHTHVRTGGAGGVVALARRPKTEAEEKKYCPVIMHTPTHTHAYTHTQLDK